MKYLTLCFASMFLFFSCQKDPDLIQLADEPSSLEIRGKSLVAICHNGMVLNVNVNSVPAHQAHGDAVDMDGDGFFDIASDCSATDCNDEDPLINPDAEEICDGVDNNCDGTIDEGVKNTYFADADGDGFGDPESPLEACDPPSGYVSDNTDCDDTAPNIYPGAPSNNGDPYFDDFNDCNLNEYTYFGGSISITGSGLAGCGVYMTHYARQQPNNFYATGREFFYGVYEIDAKANDYISDNIVSIFGEAALTSKGWYFSFRPKSTDNPGLSINYGGRQYSTSSISVSRGQWYHIKIDVSPQALLVNINGTKVFEDNDLANIPIPPSKGYFKAGVAFSGTYDNMQFTPAAGGCE